MFRFAVQRPVIVAVGILILCLLGALAVFQVPVQMIPDIEARVLTIDTRWPGATPQDIEKEIIIEQEEYLRRIPGLERITSRATTARAEIELEFPLGIDINEVLILVNNALSQVPSYPENVDEPRINTSSVSDNPFMFFSIQPLPGNPKDVDILTQQDFVDDYVRTRIEQVPGVSDVGATGGGERQIRILVDPSKLAQRNLRLIDVRNAIRVRNQDVSGGDVDSGKRRFLLRTVGRFQTVEDIQNLVLDRRGQSLIRLRDVATVEMGYAEIRNYAYTRSRPMIGMRLRKEVGANVVEVKEGVVAAVAELNEGLLAERGLVLNISSDDVVYVVEAVRVVWRNLLIGAALATAVMYLFLRSPSATLIGSLGIPICTIAAFLGLLLTGRTINVISLAGVAFAIGMTLDNNIVVLENIYRHLAMGKDRIQAALDGVTEVWPAVLASTLTTVFVFLPIVFIEDEAGQLYSDIAVAIAASIVMSLIVATTLVPTACGRLLAPAKTDTDGSPGVLTGIALAARRRIVASVEWLLESVGRRLALIFGALGAAAAILLFLTPAAEYLPEGEEAKVFGLMFAPPGYNIDTMREVYREIDGTFSPHFDADPKDFKLGVSDIPAIRGNVSFVNTGQVFYLVEATDRTEADLLVDQVSGRIRELPGLLAFATRGSIFSGNSGGTRSINVDISAPDLPTLFDASFSAFVKARGLFDNPQVRPDPSNLTMGQPLLEIRPNWERAAELGVDTANLGYTVWAYSDGAFVDEFFLEDDKIDMFLFSSRGNIEHPRDIDRVNLYTSTGAVVPLSAVADVQETVNTETIRRVDGERTVTLSIVPPRAVPLETGLAKVRSEIVEGMRASGAVPESVQMTISGASDRLEITRDALSGNFVVAVVIAYLLLVAVFSHWGYPLLIMTSIPIGVSGGIVGLWLLNLGGQWLPLVGLQAVYQPFDLITMLGFLVLIGTVVNNPILIVERTMRNLKDHAMSTREAVLESVASRIRPITMSMITTVFGLAPLVFVPGSGTELYRGLGAIVLFGLLFSTLITLTFVPSVLSLILDLGARWQDRKVLAEAAV
ncbi:MAG: efflux RND transporter permease subunit [Pseudomonadota bacterium]